MKNRTSKYRFAVCIDSEGYLASLEKGKLYRVIPDPVATDHNLIRVVDESGEDYAYPTRRFFPISVAEAVKKVLVKAPANKSLQRTSPRARRFAPRPAAGR